MRKLILFILCSSLCCALYAKEHKNSNNKAPKEQPAVEEPADIYLNFENASLESIVHYLAEQKKINFIHQPPKGLKAKKVTMTTRQPLTLSRAWEIMITLLEIHGFTLVDVDGVHRIVPNKTHKQEPLPFYSSNQGTEPEDLPDSDTVIRYVYTLTNISTRETVPILKGLLGNDKIHPINELSTFILTDKCYKIKSAMKIIKVLDKEGLREHMKILKLHHTDSTEIKTLLEEKVIGKKREQVQKNIRFFGPQKKAEFSYFSKTTKIISDKRQNSLIFLGLEEDINRIISFINKYLDIPMDAAQSRIHIKELKYVKADEMKDILDLIIEPPGGNDKKKKIVEGFKFFEDVTIAQETAEEKGDKSRGSGNRLIISCGKDDWKRLEKLINKLDKPKPQIALEVMIVDIDNNTRKQLGTQIREKTGKKLSHGMQVFTTNLQQMIINPSVSEKNESDIETGETENYNPDLTGIATGESRRGVTEATIGKPGDVWSVIKTYFAIASTNVISQPFIVTRSGESCEVNSEVIKRVPGKLAEKGLRQTLSYEETTAKTNVKITPRINIAGLIDLLIKIKIDEFLGTGTADKPEKSNRWIDTRTTLKTGEVLVLGGLTRRNVTTEEYKTPILGDIPLLGNLFKAKSKSHRKTNIYVFIRPSIIKPHFEGGPDEYTQLKVDYAKYQIFNVEGLRTSKDPIQRWFFKPEKQTIKQKMEDIKKGVHRSIDGYAQGKRQPKSVRIKRDPYFRAEEEVAREIKAEKNLDVLKEYVKKRAREIQAEKKADRKKSPDARLSSLRAKNKKQNYLLPSLRNRRRRRRS